VCVFQLANGFHNIALQEEKQLGLKLCLHLIQTLSTHVVCKHMIGLGMAWHGMHLFVTSSLTHPFCKQENWIELTQYGVQCGAIVNAVGEGVFLCE
jgi:hypothetical protein